MSYGITWFHWDSRLKRFTLMSSNGMWIFVQFSWRDWIIYHKEKDSWTTDISVGLIPFVQLHFKPASKPFGGL